MTKFLSGVFAICSVFARPLDNYLGGSMPDLVSDDNLYDEFGQFAMRYVTAEGTVVSERTKLLLTPDGTGYTMIVEGKISYIGDDGEVHVTKYTADEDGYHVNE